MPPIRTETLPNGLVIEVHDLSNRYFGDYWRISLEIRCRIPLQAAFADPADPEMARARIVLGDEVVYQRTMEKMGVSSGDLEEARQRLVDRFLLSARDYLVHPEFPARFIRQQMAGRNKVHRLFPVKK